MPIPSRRLAVVALSVLLTALPLAACSAEKAGHPGSTAGTAAPGPAVAIPVGAGPQSVYAASPQPAPDSCHFRYTADRQPLPDPACTPGATSPAVTQATVATTICKAGGYTSAIRPSTGVTSKEKAANAKSYGYTGPMGDAEYDHLISLQLGGDPNDPRNLWVEPPSPGHVPGKGPNNPKDSVETRLHTAICKNQVTLAAAQQAIAADWTTAEARLGLSAGPATTSDPDDDAN
ncbi:hypothetical protein P3T37_001417 [Kitasatospora sp. MAA4]|uniref:hypothetical protein n=1 Tax=Kitasatospora sp. MAA4 TaxID=3035093 RepID=UPI0024766E2A|nr:hypothetical protein [Kitasatospora sp. MAA4]MDH6132032.1 hypothetical protein [Kitasatospora sp. MAA4]